MKAIALGVFTCMSLLGTRSAAADSPSQPSLVEVLAPDSTKLATVVGRHVRSRYGSYQSEYLATYLTWVPRLSQRLSAELTGVHIHERYEQFADSSSPGGSSTTSSVALARAGVALRAGRYTVRAAAFLPGATWGAGSEHGQDVQEILLSSSSEELYGAGLGISTTWLQERWSVTARLDLDVRRFHVEDDDLFLPLPHLSVGGTTRVRERVWAILEASLRPLDPRLVRAGAGVDWVTPRVAAGLRIYAPHNGDSQTVLEYELQATLRY